MKQLILSAFAALTLNVGACFAQVIEVSEPDCYLRDFEKIWADKTIQVSQTVKNPGIKDFVLAFCNEYAEEWGGSLQHAIDYFKNPKQWTKEMEEEGAPDFCEYAPRNGYFVAGTYGDSDMFDACFWNCKNGNKLFALDWAKDTDCLYAITLFYDYNPQTHKMVPNKDLTARVKNARLKLAGKYPITYVTLSLPKQGKTIKMENWETEEKASYTFDGTKFSNLK